MKLNCAFYESCLFENKSLQVSSESRAHFSECAKLKLTFSGSGPGITCSPGPGVQAVFCSKAASTTSPSPWKAPLPAAAATHPPAWSWTSGQPQTGVATKRRRRRRLVIKWLGRSPGWLQSVLPGHFICCFTLLWQGVKGNGSYWGIGVNTGNKPCTASASLKMNFVSSAISDVFFYGKLLNSNGLSGSRGKSSSVISSSSGQIHLC